MVQVHSDWALVLIALIPTIPAIIAAVSSARNSNQIRDVHKQSVDNAVKIAENSAVTRNIEKAVNGKAADAESHNEGT